MKDYPRLYGYPLTEPIQVQPLLRDPEKHWKKGRSAYEVAHSWISNNAVPPAVAALVAKAPEWADVQIISGFFEHSTALDTMAAPSCTDMLAVCRLRDSLGVLAVEGKAGEPFGELVSVWNTTPGRSARLDWACALFGVDREQAATLRWQLFHRTACAVKEAQRFCAPSAIMVVHDFGLEASGKDDFAAFAQAIGAEEAGVDAISKPVTVEGVALRLAWVRDNPC